MKLLKFQYVARSHGCYTSSASVFLKIQSLTSGYSILYCVQQCTQYKIQIDNYTDGQTKQKNNLSTICSLFFNISVACQFSLCSSMCSLKSCCCCCCCRVLLLYMNAGLLAWCSAVKQLTQERQSLGFSGVRSSTLDSNRSTDTPADCAGEDREEKKEEKRLHR